MAWHITSVALIAAIPLFYLVIKQRHKRSAIQHIPGPPSNTWLFGHMQELILAHDYGDHEFKWLKTYGPVYRTKGCFGQDRLRVSDPVAMQYVLNSQNFPLSPVLQQATKILAGDNAVLVSDYETHKRLRAGLNNGFNTSAVRSCQSVFERVAQTTISQKLEAVAGSGSPVDICTILGAATLETISEGKDTAVFGYSIARLGDEFLESNLKITSLSASQSSFQIIADAIASYLPPWLLSKAIYLPTPVFKILLRARYLAEQLGKQSIREKKDLLQQGVDVNTDMFGFLLESNKAQELISEDEIVAQTQLLLLAGQDTTANTAAFGFLELAKNKKLQDELRLEIYSFSGIEPRNYDSMPLLNAFIKECLRIYPAVPNADRIATQDLVIPLSESLTARTGEKITHIPVKKGQVVSLGIAAYHRLESRWGKDANVFRPSRWLDGTVRKGDAIGPYANLLTFLGGPHTCLGWRFASVTTLSRYAP
ncbi:Cytochrome P450 [Mycena venus]|uniref:Cytochrome P450 n=1 Tax=Mycena venus TaxID=2733690 RepID=A0A8H6X2V2_9AGAR|nr:Cytochrome P450 [Mycena venus]